MTGQSVEGLPAMTPLEQTAEHRLLRETVSAIVGRFGHAYYQKCAETGEPMTLLWEALGQAGLLGLNVPQEFGGGGAGLTELAIVLEEMSAGGCPELALVLSPGMAGSIISAHGTAEQKATYLPGIASGRQRFAFSLTEADAGSNSKAINTRAVRDGADWVINGAKVFTSGVDHSEYMLLAARTDSGDGGPGGITVFIVPTEAPGLSRSPIPTALRAPERQFALFFDDVRIADRFVVGEIGGGLSTLFDALNPERVLSAAICIGVGRYALAKASQYARDRTVWRTPIGAHQGVAHPLAASAIEIEAARLMSMRAAALFDARRPAGEFANMAKYLASKAGHHALDVAIQVHGGNGLADEFGLADLWGIIRLQQIAPVSTEMVLNFVGQHVLKLPRSY